MHEQSVLETRLGRLAAAFGGAAGLAVLVWQADTLRLRPSGADLVWPVLVGFAVAWMARTQAAWRPGIALVGGAGIGVAAVSTGARVLPLTTGGEAIALGIAFLAVGIVAVISRGVLPAAPAVAGLGVGVAAAKLAGLGPATAGGDAMAVWTAASLSMVVGLAGVVVVSAVEQRRRRDVDPRTGDHLEEVPERDIGPPLSADDVEIIERPYVRGVR